MTKAKIYSKRNCPSCLKAKQLLEQKGVTYVEYYVDSDSDKFKEMKLRANGAQTVPQIIINNELIGGFDDLWALEKSGELDQKLRLE